MIAVHTLWKLMQVPRGWELSATEDIITAELSNASGESADPRSVFRAFCQYECPFSSHFATPYSRCPCFLGYPASDVSNQHGSAASLHSGYFRRKDRTRPDVIGYPNLNLLLSKPCLLIPCVLACFKHVCLFRAMLACSFPPLLLSQYLPAISLLFLSWIACILLSA